MNYILLINKALKYLILNGVGTVIIINLLREAPEFKLLILSMGIISFISINISFMFFDWRDKDANVGNGEQSG